MKDKQRPGQIAGESASHHLQNELRRLQKAVETMQLGVTITDVDGRIVYTNNAEARMHGYTVDELIGRDVSLFCLPGYRKALNPEQLRDLKSWRRETMNVRKDGSLLPVTLMSDVVLDNEGAPIGVVTTCEDLTEVKRDEAERDRLALQVQHSRKLESLGVLARGIAHDFNNLLVGILGNASLLLSDLEPGASPIHFPALRDRVVEVENAARRLSDLTNQLLAYSGSRQCVTRPVNLNSVINGMVHLLEISKRSGVTLRYDLASDLPYIDADEGLVQQLLKHMTTNASDAIGAASGVISLRTRTLWADREYLSKTYLGESANEGRYVVLEISDTGSGIDPVTEERVFDPFFTTKAEGRGLGLSVVMGIVRAHHGAIRVESSRDLGTTFTVLFPATATPAPLSEPQPEGAVQGTGTILVVEAEPSVRKVAGALVERLGFQVLSVDSGRQALAALREGDGQIAAVLLDFQMPHMSGETVFAKIHRAYPQIPVIIMSGFAEEDVWDRFLDTPPAGFLHKPFGAAELTARLREAVPFNQLNGRGST